MQTIPLGSRTIGAHSAPTFAIATEVVTWPQQADDLTLVAATQSYLACLVGGTPPSPPQAHAWDEFYHRFRPTITRAVRSRTCDALVTPLADAEQEVWAALIERLNTFRVDASLGSFPGWLQTVAQRRLTDDRRAQRRRPVPRTWDEPPVDLVGPEADPAEAYERADERTLLAALLERLRVEVTPTNYRLLHLRAIEERPVAEVATLLGLTPAQVRLRHHRLLDRLRELASGPKKKIDKISARAETPSLRTTCM